MKIKLSDIRPNPFKKEINGGKLDEETIKKIRSNLKELGLMGSLPVFKKDEKYYLIAGHHRAEALKREFGKDYEVSIDLKDYNESQILRGMVIENITQRDTDFQERKENFLVVEKYLNSHPHELITLRESRSVNNSGSYKKEENKSKATASDIAYWINISSGDSIVHDKVLEVMNIAKNVAPELQEKITKTQNVSNEIKTDNDVINETQAVILSRIENHDEQKDIFNAMKNSEEQRVREQAKLVSLYKQAPEDIKQKVRDCEIDLKDVEDAIIQQQIKEHNKNKETIEIIPNFETKTKDLITQIDRLETQVMIFKKVFGHNSFKQRYNSLPRQTQQNVNSFIKSIHNRVKDIYEQVSFFYEELDDIKKLR